MNPELLKRLAQQELQARESPPPDVLQECLPHQLNFIKDPSRRKVVLGTRRSAKSFMLALYLISAALKTPKGKFIYMALTNESARRTMWSDIFETIFTKYNIQADLNSKLEIHFSNGAVIYLRGLDATPHQMNKLRGQKFDLACIDECQDFTQDLRQIIKGVLQMTLAQSQATLVLAGTPGNQLGNHYFWQIHKPESEETEWNKFFFEWKDNTSIDPKSNMRVCDAIQQEVDEEIKRNPLIVNTPTFQQEILGKWVIQTDARVYRSDHTNYIHEIPIAFYVDAVYILSTDLGYVDATAYTVSAYNKKFNNKMYVIESFKKTKQTITDVAKEIKRLQEKYKEIGGFKQIVIDAANLQAVEEMRKIHHLPLTAAEKAGKQAHIALLNSDLITKNVAILKHANLELIEELETLIWDQKALIKGKHKESATKDNHLTDSLLYAHHASRHYWFKPANVPVTDVDELYDQHIDEVVGIKPKNQMKLLKKPFWQEDDNGY